MLDDKQLQYIVRVAEYNINMPVWKYNDQCYLKMNEELLLITELIYLMKLPKVNNDLFSFANTYALHCGFNNL